PAFATGILARQHFGPRLGELAHPLRLATIVRPKAQRPLRIGGGGGGSRARRSRRRAGCGRTRRAPATPCSQPALARNLLDRPRRFAAAHPNRTTGGRLRPLLASNRGNAPSAPAL